MRNLPFGIAMLDYYLPEEVRTVDFWARSTSQPDSLITGLIDSGARRYHVAAENETVSDMALEAVRRMFARHSIDPSQIGLILYTHTFPFSIPAPPLSVADLIRREFGCDKAVGFSFAQQNCASLFGAMYLVGGLMEAEDDLQSVLLVTADKVIDEYARNIRDELILSDAASAILLRRGENRNVVAAMSHFADARYRPLPGMKNELARNCTVYHSKTVRRVLEITGLRPDQIGLAFTLNERPATGLGVLQLCQIPADRIFNTNISRIGHAFQSDFAINLQDWFELRLPAPEHCLAFMNGDNGTFYSMIIENLQPTSPLAPRDGG